MRLSPTPEVADYLKAIGVFGPPAASPPVAAAKASPTRRPRKTATRPRARVPKPASPAPPTPIRRSDTSLRPLYLMIVGFVLLFVAAALSAHATGQEPFGSSGRSPRPPAAATGGMPVPRASAAARATSVERPSLDGPWLETLPRDPGYPAARQVPWVPASTGTAEALPPAVRWLALGLMIGGLLLVLRHHVHEAERWPGRLRRQTPPPPVQVDAVPAPLEAAADPAPASSASELAMPPVLRRLRDRAMRQPQIHHLPVPAEGPWQVGCATATGNVRTENQDAALCFRIADQQVAIVADGCGGTPLGRQAAHVAMVYAAAIVTLAYGKAATGQLPLATKVAEAAVWSAARGLARTAERLGIAPEEDGLRTTLIVLLGDVRTGTGGFAHIGDGGGFAVSARGAMATRWLEEQHLPDQHHVLTASLGPSVQGLPRVGELRRAAGDLWIAGSDGVFGFVDPEAFPLQVLAACRQFDGDLQHTAERLVAELAAYRDDRGYVCDDNLTLAIMGDGTCPVVPEGQPSSAPSASPSTAGGES